MQFANALVDLFPDLVKTSCGRAPVPASGVPSALQSFQNLKDDHVGLKWARLDEVYTYLRGGRDLRIPPHWRKFVPVVYPSGGPGHLFKH